ncbi:hypothetical protein [Micromonospora echinaurantiaca]|uniref:hypothetical protein n=1 Tax=Micromonospora echinaurantiaca TaxID=47857 RepID=UPI00379BA9FE
MAGTLIYQLQLAHTFQRRFDSEELGRALSESHIYVISRRPQVRLKEQSVMFHPRRIQFEVTTKANSKASHVDYSLDLAHEGLQQACDFRTYQDGSYFSFRLGAALMHGDSWALAALCSRTKDEISRQEVMYIGMAYGKNGSSNAWHRTKRHEKLQRIYEDHVDGGWDIFVSAYEIVSCERAAVDHIDDSEGGNPLGILDEAEVFWDRRGERPSETAVKLIEHSLIAYFDPPYNKTLNQWRADDPTAEMRSMQNAGFRLIVVHLSGYGSLARLHSRQVKSATRSHVILHDIPPVPRRPVLRGLSAEMVSGWRASLLRLDDVEGVIAEGELSDIVLHSFGERAPSVRKPPEVDLDFESDHRTLEEREEEFKRISTIEAQYAGPDFDHETGRFSVGIGLDGTKMHWEVWDQNRLLRNGVIMGPPDSGKTNSLTVAIFGYLDSGLFIPWLGDGGGRHNLLRKWGRAADWIASNPRELELMLGAAVAIAEGRRTDSAYQGISRKTPGILLAVEDLHLALDNAPHLVEKFERLSEIGPASGVATVVTVPDSNLARFGGSRKLRSNLGSGHRQVFGIFDGDDLFADLEAP